MKSKIMIPGLKKAVWQAVQSLRMLEIKYAQRAMISGPIRRAA